jgi:hypothetical protein
MLSQLRRHMLRVVPVIGVTMVILVIVSLVAAMPRPSPSSASQRARGAGSVITHVHFSQGGDPSYSGLTVAQQLDRALAVPGIVGLVEGTVGVPITHVVSDSIGPTVVMTDFRFAVAGFLGHSESPYATGSTIVLRVPGGISGKLVTIVEGAPTVGAGDHLFVFVRNQGMIGGGNTSTRLVASNTADVFVVIAGKVHGQGTWATLSEPIAAFKLHFRP